MKWNEVARYRCTSAEVNEIQAHYAGNTKFQLDIRRRGPNDYLVVIEKWS